MSVYPRWRGEHWKRLAISTTGRGLSPLARGTLIDCVDNKGFTRFIPAGAGNARKITAGGNSDAVYPRWRGERTDTAAQSGQSAGLSPLARGTHLLGHVWGIELRFIPAGAGNALLSAATSARNAVYPRWRGEHNSGYAFACQPLGLSPLARGTRHGAHHAAVMHRFIPAGAGNTL